MAQYQESEGKEKSTSGTRSYLRAWVKKHYGMTMTSWYKLPREERLKRYMKYQKGINP